MPLGSSLARGTVSCGMAGALPEGEGRAPAAALAASVLAATDTLTAEEAGLAAADALEAETATLCAADALAAEAAALAPADALAAGAATANPERNSEAMRGRRWGVMVNTGTRRTCRTKSRLRAKGFILARSDPPVPRVACAALHIQRMLGADYTPSRMKLSAPVPALHHRMHGNAQGGRVCALYMDLSASSGAFWDDASRARPGKIGLRSRDRSRDVIPLL